MRLVLFACILAIFSSQVLSVPLRNNTNGTQVKHAPKLNVTKPSLNSTTVALNGTRVKSAPKLNVTGPSFNSTKLAVNGTRVKSAPKLNVTRPSLNSTTMASNGTQVKINETRSKTTNSKLQPNSTSLNSTIPENNSTVSKINKEEFTDFQYLIKTLINETDMTLKSKFDIAKAYLADHQEGVLKVVNEIIFNKSNSTIF
ncbi:unnamed protein product [Caenorhabditis angaria]|uniref:SXP/RAL-2 family protein Ani s 5-like cation-binding domain-containing protein n=1 Tax=Caenorhabditis angaria TaxID=860376 RepID=A0A9P1N8H5_9PELO|nr:unnamed protein product [Caenorhabditis angaria]